MLKTEGQAKVGGTIVCASGAILIVLFRGPALLVYADDVPGQKNATAHPELAGWMFSSFAVLGIDNCHLGVLCLIGNCICMAAFLTIQAPVLATYSANISVTAYSYFFGTLFMVATAVSMYNESANWNLTLSEVWAVIYAVTGICASALNYGLLTWSNKILGQSTSTCCIFFSLKNLPWKSNLFGKVTWATYREKGQVDCRQTSEPLID